MVLRNRERKMASEQPVKKKLRITDEDDPTQSHDETDFIITPVNNDDTDPNAVVVIAKRQERTLANSGEFSESVIRGCLCGMDSSVVQRQLEVRGCGPISQWPVPNALGLLSNLQLLLDVYLKQNSRGHICAAMCDVCEFLVRDGDYLVRQLLDLAATNNKYVGYLGARVLASLLIVAKGNVDVQWLDAVVAPLSCEHLDYGRMTFSLEVVRRVVEWRDVDLHVLEEADLGTTSNSWSGGGAAPEAPPAASVHPPDCTVRTFTDHESYDTSAVKCLAIKRLQTQWPNLIKSMRHTLIQLTQSTNRALECTVLSFLSLWESIVSVRANLSVADTRPLQAHLDSLVPVLGGALPAVLWRQMLSLFNEVLCYGSTLALQDMLPEETCALAHLVVRHVKDFRLLDGLPTTQHTTVLTATNKTLLQKLVLLVLKSVAVTVKETRCDSSDSSAGSDDYDFYQDMQLIERSIREVIRKVDNLVKHSLDLHPETPFPQVLVHLLSDQDDYMIEAMVCTLDTTVGISYGHGVLPDLQTMLDPARSLVYFLRVVAHDSDVLLDYLVSNETCFLLYLLRLLKYVRRNWASFAHSCRTVDSASAGCQLERTMAVLIRLRHQISRLVSRHLFPYNIGPVLRLLETCENLYEGNEMS